MGAPDRMVAFPHPIIASERPMSEIVPDQAAAANRPLSRRLMVAFRADVDARVGDGDFACREVLTPRPTHGARSR